MTTIRVLVVDDAAVFRRSACQFLARLPGVQVVGTASSGAEGIELARQLGPDLVLMDILMSGMSGLAATAFLKWSMRAPRVIVVSQHDDPEYRAAAKEALADGFVCKTEFATRLPEVIESLFAPLPGARADVTDA